MDVTGIATAVVVGVLSGIVAAWFTAHSNERIAAQRIESDERIASERLEADRARWGMEMERAQADRFLDLRRDRYATFLSRVDDVLVAFTAQHREPVITAVEQDAMLALAGMKGELELLSPVVAEHANAIAGRLAAYSVHRSRTPEVDNRRAALSTVMTAIREQHEPAFLKAARSDLGLVTQTPSS